MTIFERPRLMEELASAEETLFEHGTQSQADAVGQAMRVLDDVFPERPPEARGPCPLCEAVIFLGHPHMCSGVRDCDCPPLGFHRPDCPKREAA